jgi:murein DD-endopeptidase MepM/ murein hydrolase activator NlpD
MKFHQAKPLARQSRFSKLPRALGLALGLVLVTAQLASANTLGTLTIRSTSGSLPLTEDNVDAILKNGSAMSDIVANRTIALQPGDTIDALLEQQGVDAGQRAAALKALGELYDIDQVKPGDVIEVSLRASLDGSQETQLVALQLRPAYKGNLAVVAGADGAFHRLGSGAKRAKSIASGITTREGTVARDLISDLAAHDVPQDVAEDVASAFIYDPATPSTPEQGSRFKVVYETTTTQAGNTAHVMRYAELATQGVNHRVYRYETNDGKVAFMEETGRGVVPFALAAPIRKARMSSGFGWRLHPVLKVRKFHNGVDFAAPKGTPIYAAEDGIIQTIAWRGNYGRFIKIEHNDRVATTYGHMSAFAKGLHKGSKVKKGQVIAYVGSSGLSTGNHLYFEVLVDNKHVDPAETEVMLNVNLDGSSLVRFRSYVSRISESQNLIRP